MLTKITFTGIDNKTKINDLEALYNKYPFVEFGVLISETNTNKNIINRYPNLDILKDFKDKNIPLALHVCGRIAREIIQNNNWEPLYELIGEYIDLFQRIQLNVAGIKKFDNNIIFPSKKTFIIQTNSKTDALYQYYKHLPNIVGFQDNSGGLGIVENSFKIFDGYAGGINIDNVLDILDNIEKVNNDSFWIDMESSIRTNDNFDIKICEKICEKVIKSKHIIVK